MTGTLDISQYLKGKVIDEVFWNDFAWVIKFEDKTAITLELEEVKRKAVYYMNENNIVLRIERDEVKQNKEEHSLETK